MAEPARPRARRGGPTLVVVVDLWRHAVRTRSLLPIVIILVAALAALSVFIGQTVLPYAIYPVL